MHGALQEQLSPTAQDAISCSPVDYQYLLYQAICEEILSEVLILRSVCYSPVWLLDISKVQKTIHAAQC